MRYIVYVLSSLKDKKSYVGFTNNIERRLHEHNTGKSNFTKKYLPWEVLYKEEFDSKIEARKREKYLKSSAGRKLIVARLFNN